MELFRYKKVRVVLLFFIGIIVVLIGIFIYKATQNPYGSQLDVADLNKYTSGKPIDTNSENYIKHDLYRTVNYNVRTPVGNNSIKDILVRNKSFSQTYDASTHVYTVHFIVDIKSIKQSYRVSYEWTSNDAKYGPNKSEYGTQVTCLPINKLVYGDFNCKDAQIIGIGVNNHDPIEKLLPYHVVSKFKITSYKRSSKYVVLYVDAYAKSNEVSVSQQDLSEYSSEINSWLQSNNLDPSHYTINYTY